MDELLFVQRGREMGLALGDQQFNQIVENIKKQNNLEDEERFQAALKQEGMTMADLRRSLERQMFVGQVQQRDVVEKISVTDDEARAYYDKNRQEFTTPSEVTLREILIDVPVTDRGINAAQDDEAKEEAEAVRKRALAGEPFARLAAEVSDAPSKANGGLIGPISRDELAPALQKQIDAMKVGEITEPIRTAARLPDPEARDPHRNEDPHLRRSAGRHQPEGRRRKAPRRADEVPRTPAQPGHDHLAQRRAEESYEQALAERRRTLGLAPAPRDQAGHTADLSLQPCLALISPRTEADVRPRLCVITTGLAWFALWTRSRHEQVVREQLEQKQIEAFLPTVTKWSRWKDRKKKIDWPLFPGYCFARFDPRERLPILKCTGVVSIISFEGEPAVIPEHEIQGIRQLVESDLAYDPCPMIREGMMVEVVHGPLKGVIGRLIRKNEKARLVLSVDLIGQAVSVEVDAADVRAY